MTKRILTLILVAALLLTVLPISATAETNYVKTANGKSLNLRSAPVTHANNRICWIPYGAAVTYICWVDSTWSYVRYNGYEGYVQTRYLTSTKPASKPVTPSTTKKPSSSSTSSSTITASDFNNFVNTSYSAVIEPSNPGGLVNLRWAPGKNYPSQAKLTDGAAVDVIAENGTWCQVRVVNTGAVGFVMKDFVVQSVGSDS